MNNIERHCDTCNDSYYETERNPSGGKERSVCSTAATPFTIPPSTRMRCYWRIGTRASAAFGPLSQRKEKMIMKDNYTIAQRNALVEKYLWCIDTVIRKNRPLMRAAQLEYDVYHQLALRLIKAVTGFDPQKGTLQQHIFAQLKYELLNCKSACRLCGLTGAPKEYRKRDMVSLDALSENSPLYEGTMAA